MRWYKHERLRSALQFLRRVDYCRGNPKVLIEQRRRKPAEVRHRRGEVNLEIRQRTLCFEGTFSAFVASSAKEALEDQALTYSETLLRRWV